MAPPEMVPTKAAMLKSEEGSDMAGGSKGHVLKTHKLEALTLSIAYAILRHTSVSSSITITLQIVEDFQLLSLLYREEYGLNADAAYYLSQKFYTASAQNLRAFFIISVIMTGMITAVFAYVTHALQRGNLRSVFSLKVLQLAAIIVDQMLLIPTTIVFFGATAACTSWTSNPGGSFGPCFTGEHLGFFISGLLMIFTFLPRALVLPAMLCDATPTIKIKPNTKVDGRLDSVYAACRILIASIQTLVGVRGHEYVMLVLQIGIYAGLMWAYCTSLPYYAASRNQIRTASLGAALLTAVINVILVAAQITGSVNDIVVVVAGVLGCVVGAYAPVHVLRYKVRSIYGRLKEELDSEPSETSSPLSGKRRSVASSAMGRTPKDLQTVGFKPTDIETITKTRTVVKQPLFNRAGDVEIACRYVCENHDEEGLSLMHYIFALALRQYPKNAQVHLAYAYYIFEFDKPRFKLAQQLVRKTTRHLKMGIAERIPLFYIQRSLERHVRTQNGEVEENQLSITSFAEYQALEQAAGTFHTRTLEELRSFWGYLAAAGVKASVLPMYAQRINAVQIRGEAYYKKMVQRFPKSKTILRMYGTWLQQVKYEPELAQEFYHMADDIEAKETKHAVIMASRQENAEEQAGGQILDDSRRSSKIDKQVKSAAPVPPRILMRKASKSSVMEEIQAHTSTNRGVDPLHDGSIGSETKPDAFQRNCTSTGDMQSASPPFTAGEDEQPAAQSAGILPSLHIEKTSPPNYHRRSVRMEPELSMQPEAAQTSQQGSTEHFSPPSGGPEKTRCSWQASAVGAQPEEVEKKFDDEFAAMRSESNHSSSASTKEARLRKLQKVQVQTRLCSSVRSYNYRVWFTAFLFIVMTVVSFIVGRNQCAEFSLELQDVSTSTRLGAKMMRISKLIRQMVVAGQMSDLDQYVLRQNDLSSLLLQWKSLFIPFLRDLFDRSFNVRYMITQYPSTSRRFVWGNEYDVGTQILRNGMMLSNQTFDYFASDNILYSNEVRFFGAENIMHMGEPLDALSRVGLDAYLIITDSSMTVLYILMSLIGIAAIILAFGLLYPMIMRTATLQINVMKVFTEMPKKACRHLLTDVEENLENFASAGQDEGLGVTDDAKLQAPAALMGQSADKKSSNRMLRNASICIFLNLVFAISIFIPPILLQTNGITTVKLIVWSDLRRYKMNQVMRLAYELAANDGETQMAFDDPSDIDAQLRDSINVLAGYHNLVTTGISFLGNTLDVPPTTSVRSIADITVVPGLCLLETEDMCSPENQDYDKTIGFTEELVRSGLDNVLKVFIDAARIFEATPTVNQSLENPTYLLASALDPHIVSGFDKIVNSLISDQFKMASIYQQAMAILFPLAIISVFGSLFVFQSIKHELTSELAQIVQLLFSVPPSMLDQCPRMRQYIQSGGVVGLEEKEKM